MAPTPPNVRSAPAEPGRPSTRRLARCELFGSHHQLDARVDPELLVDLMEMKLHRAHRDRQITGDALVGQAARREARYLELLRRERFRRLVDVNVEWMHRRRPLIGTAPGSRPAPSWLRPAAPSPFAARSRASPSYTSPMSARLPDCGVARTGICVPQS